MLIKRSLLTALLLAYCLTVPNLTKAQALLDDSDGEKFTAGCISTGACQVSDFTVLLVRIAQAILGLTGSLSLLAFVYGGALFLLSSGNKEMVEKGKSSLTGAAIGMLVVYMSYAIIGFTITVFNPAARDTWSSSDWFSRQQTK